jgi:hypothetical protein
MQQAPRKRWLTLMRLSIWLDEVAVTTSVANPREDFDIRRPRHFQRARGVRAPHGGNPVLLYSSHRTSCMGAWKHRRSRRRRNPLPLP